MRAKRMMIYYVFRKSEAKQHNILTRAVKLAGKIMQLQ